MRSFFVQIYLAFWVTSVGIFIAFSIAFPSGPLFRSDVLLGALDSLMTQAAKLQAGQNAARSCAASPETSLLIFGSDGRELCGKAIPPGVAQLVNDVFKTGQRELTRADHSWALAEPVPAVSGGHALVAVLLRPSPPREWFPHMPPYTVPVSALVTFVFAYLLSKPVRALRSAFRQFAAGDMSVRLPVARNALRDWGGADVRTLMIDFNEMAARIQALVEAHKTLLRDVSHELRSPLARLNVALELAREETGGSAAALDRAELESSRLNALIGELLSLSLMETIHDPPGSKLHPGEVIDKLMPDLQFEAEARGCRVIHTRLGDCPIAGSEELLRRAVENIIRNAIRYSPAGADITIETLTDGESGALIRVYDSGPGVPEDNLQAIFGPFYRVDSARQATTGGFGVGLAIAQRAVQIHGGTIRAFNRQPSGLCVEVCLPCARPVDG